MFASVRINVHEPMANLLKAVVMHMWGFDSQAVRMVSLLLHGVAAFVLWAASTNLVSLATQIDPSRVSFGCAASSLLFFLHPIHVEVVAWPSTQPYTLALCFSSMAFLLHTWTISTFLTSVKSLQFTSRDYFNYFATTGTTKSSLGHVMITCSFVRLRCLKQEHRGPCSSGHCLDGYRCLFAPSALYGAFLSAILATILHRQHGLPRSWIDCGVVHVLRKSWWRRLVCRPIAYSIPRARCQNPSHANTHGKTAFMAVRFATTLPNPT